MENTITLKRTEQGWVAEYSGPIRTHIYNLFRSAEIPTGFTARATHEVVRREIQRLNPDCIVVIR
jgi:hypothetical protein